ncbi:MAG: site-specific integrase [Eubacteriales bacterium]
MPAYKDEKKGTWYVQFYFKDWQGKQTKKLKRGFLTKKEAQAWERDFLQQKSADMSMTFENFIAVYTVDMKNRLKENSWLTKEHIINSKILPYFKHKKLSEIEPRDVIAWQNQMMAHRDAKGMPYSPVYLKTLHNQLSAILNHAVRFYGLQSNPARKAGNMGKEKGTEVDFWTKEDYLLFLDEMRDKPLSYYAFQLLYWCGIRMGELLALTRGDIDLEEKTLKISKSYQRIQGRDVITDPKTEKSKRTIAIPDFLAEELADFIKAQYGLEKHQRLFPISKSYLHHEMNRGCENSGVKRIKVHSLRHSHVSLLIELGFSAVAIAERVGHESIDITYRYAHLYPSKQREIADTLRME